MRDVLRTRRTALIAGAVACLAFAALFFVLAADVARWRDSIAGGDVRYRVSPGATDLWTPDVLAPAGGVEKLLGLEDDIEFRRAIRALRLASLEDPTVSDPQIALRRNEAQARLEAIATRGGDPVRRSRAAGLLGVLGLARLQSESQDRLALLQSTVANLAFAIGLDPENDDAKFNLELALQQGRGLRLDEAASGGSPRAGGAGSEGAGAGEPGTGF
jgi:hypothetical protein